MSTVVALSRIARDPALIAIENYWAAIDAWRAAERRVKRLRKKLSDDVMRAPRVQVARLYQGRDEKGADVTEPIYAHSEWEIERHVQEQCKTTISVHTRRNWVWGVNMTGFSKEAKTAEVKKARRVIRAKYKSRKKEKLAAFRADREALFARQRAAGWRQAVEAAQKAHSLVCHIRYKISKLTPTTTDGALALMRFIHDAQTVSVHSNTVGAPYGLGELYTSRIARTLANFLKRHQLPSASLASRAA